MCFLKQVILFLSVLAYVNTLGWDYVKDSPEYWPYLEGESFEKCGSDMQSPINIKSERVRCDATQSLIRPLELVDGYKEDVEFNFTNSALTILAKLHQRENVNLSFRGSGIPEMLSPFELVQIHFHWGQHKFEGSEHVIDNEAAPLELHLVHVSTKDSKYFAVIGIMFDLSILPNKHLDSIIRAADFLATRPTEFTLERVNIAQLLPNRLDRFYYYEGSLTTPPCTERVFWTVMADRVPISEQQLRSIQANPSKVNFRPPQPVNERLVATIDCALAGHKSTASLVKSKESSSKDSSSY